MDETFWNEMYREGGHQRWSGEPNGALVAEVSGWTPGRALDVGCGEGTDAIWLARNGWQVTATDISRVALERAERAGKEAGVEVRWLHADLLAAPPEAGAFDLVSLQYFPIHRDRGPAAARGLVDAVAPGGVLLVVSHDLSGQPEGWHGPAPEEFYHPGELAALLGEGWTVEVNEPRERPHVPQGNPHIRDVILRVRRAAAASA